MSAVCTSLGSCMSKGWVSDSMSSQRGFFSQVRQEMRGLDSQDGNEYKSESLL